METLPKKTAGKKFAKAFIGEIADQFYKFYNLSDKELVAVLKRAKELSTTNCGWHEYRLKGVFIHFAEDAQTERKRSQKANRLTAKK